MLYHCYLNIQGIPAFRDFTIRDPRYFMILFSDFLIRHNNFKKFNKHVDLEMPFE